MRKVLSYVIAGFSLITFGFAFLTLTSSGITGYMVASPEPIIPSASVLSGIVSLLIGSYRLNKVSGKGKTDFLSQVTDFKSAHSEMADLRLDLAVNNVIQVFVDGALTNNYKKISVFHEFEDLLDKKVSEEKNPIFLQRAIITMGNAISVIKNMDNFDKKHLRNLEIMHGTAKAFLLNLYKQQNRLG